MAAIEVDSTQTVIVCLQTAHNTCALPRASSSWPLAVVVQRRIQNRLRIRFRHRKIGSNYVIHVRMRDKSRSLAYPALACAVLNFPLIFYLFVLFRLRMTMGYGAPRRVPHKYI